MKNFLRLTICFFLLSGPTLAAPVWINRSGEIVNISNPHAELIEYQVKSGLFQGHLAYRISINNDVCKKNQPDVILTLEGAYVSKLKFKRLCENNRINYVIFNTMKDWFEMKDRVRDFYGFSITINKKSYVFKSSMDDLIKAESVQID